MADVPEYPPFPPLIPFPSGTVQIAAGGLTAVGIANDAITAAKIADGAIDAATFAANAITAAAIANAAIDAATFAAGAIDATAIAAAAFTAAKFAAAALAGQIVKSIQYGTIAFASGDTTKTATISAVVVAKTMLLWLGNSANENTDVRGNWLRITLTNTTTVTANRDAATANVATASFCAVEFP